MILRIHNLKQQFFKDREIKVTIVWNQHLQTDPTNPYNKPEIISLGNEKGTCVLIVAAISGDRNVITKIVEMIL